jgi:hypothetical protein
MPDILNLRWQAGSDCVVFPEDPDENHPPTAGL